MRKTKNYLKKTQMTFRFTFSKLNPDFSEEGKEERHAGHMDVFYRNLGITEYTLENYSYFKSHFSFNSRRIFEVHDYFRARRNGSFNDLSQLINTPSNQDFAVLYKFRLRESLEKMMEINAQLIKVNKNNRNESSFSEFLSSSFSPAVPKPVSMENISLPLTAKENASLTLKKRVFAGK